MGYSVACYDGSSFGYNFLLLGGNNNLNSYFVKNTESSLWANYPNEFENELWIGVRMVFPYDDTHVLIEIHEMYPISGRIWSIFWNINFWSGWKSITPS